MGFSSFQLKCGLVVKIEVLVLLGEVKIYDLYKPPIVLKQGKVNKILSVLNIEAVGFIVVFPHLFPVVQFTCTAHVTVHCSLKSC